MNVLKMFSLLTVALLVTACDEEKQQNKSSNWHPLGIATDASTGEPSLNLDIILECRKIISDDLIFYYQVHNLEEENDSNDNSNAFTADLIIWRYYENKNNIGTPILFNSEVDVEITRVMNGNTFYEILANAKTQEQGPLEPIVLSSNSASIESGISNVNTGERLFNLFYNYEKNSNSMTTKNDFIGFYENEIQKDIVVECK